MTKLQAEIRRDYPVPFVMARPRPRLLPDRGHWVCSDRGYGETAEQAYAQWRMSVLIDARTFNLQFDPPLQ